MTKHKLIEVLKQAVKLLEDEEADYNWESWGTCNCGIVTQVATGLDEHEIYQRIHSIPVINEEENIYDGYYGTYSDKLEYCLSTNLPMPFVFETLLNLGMTPQDIKDLEYLGGSKEDKFDYCETRKEQVIDYLTHWIYKLEAE